MSVGQPATHVANLPPVERSSVTDPRLLRALEHSEATGSPPVSWYLTMGHNPDVAVAYQQYWEATHRTGSVAFEIKELCRIQIAQMIRCEFCARQVAIGAESLSEDEIQQCALPNWEHPDAKTRAALHYARTLTLDDGKDAEVHDELREHYSNAEIVELAAFFCMAIGGVRMAKSWALIPDAAEGQSSIPSGSMWIHDPA